MEYSQVMCKCIVMHVIWCRIACIIVFKCVPECVFVNSICVQYIGLCFQRCVVNVCSCSGVCKKRFVLVLRCRPINDI